jgi:hypothetical protein
MPQTRPYFSIQLPQGWWVFGIDLALDDDIDLEQFKFFARIATEKMKEGDAVIIMTHEPFWILDPMCHKKPQDLSEKYLRELCETHLLGKVKLRIAGDLHHYTRHSPDSGEGPELIVAGGGGAFLHPTHTVSETKLRFSLSFCFL